MEGQLAQMVALTCFGNAAIRGQRISDFVHDNSTCTFCEEITFKAGLPSKDGEPLFTTIAVNPNQWIETLLRRGKLGFRLRQKTQNNPILPDSITAGVVGGPKWWSIEAIRTDSVSEFWIPKWEIGNRDAPDQKIWRVTYGLWEVSATSPAGLRSFEEISGDFRLALEQVRAFAEREHCGFIKHFDDALLALNDTQADTSSFDDWIPPQMLDPMAIAILKAASRAWVFGGMGSWNDLGYDDKAVQNEYEDLTDRLYAIVNDAIEAAASSSMPPLTVAG